jgi:hypothetical protein
MSIPGSVMLYAGQEVGTSSQRGAISWGQDPNGMYPYYYKITNARKLLPALRTGRWATLTNNQSSNCYSYARFGTGMDPVIWLGNFSFNSQIVTVNVNPTQLGLQPDSTYVITDLLTGTHFSSLGSQLTSILTSLSPYQARLWVVSDTVVSVNANEPVLPLPLETKLGEAYPNPFNPTTMVPFALSQPAKVSLKVYDLLGREVITLVDGMMEAGEHQAMWDGHTAGSGVYFVVMRTANMQQARKLVLLR